MSLKSRIQSTIPEIQATGIQQTSIREETEASTVADPFAELKTRVHHDVITRLGPRLFTSVGDDVSAELTDRVRDSVEEAIALDKTPLTRQERARIALEITDDVLGYGPLEPLLRDDDRHRDHGQRPAPDLRRAPRQADPHERPFVDDEHLRRIIDKIVSRVGRRVDESSPMVDARLPDGSRVNAIIPPLAFDGPTLTIRKFRKDPFTSTT